MKKIFYLFVFFSLVLVSCQNWDYEIAEMKLTLDESIFHGELQGDNYVWTWATLENGLQMQVALYADGSRVSTEVIDGTSYTHYMVSTNVEYTYIFKLTDGTNYSTGCVKSFTREGATQISGVYMTQVENAGGYDANVEWEAAVDAESITFTATNGVRTINETLSGSATSYTIQNVAVDDVWNVTLVAVNSKGTSLAATASLRIGKTLIGFLSIYATPDELLAEGDDDEASAYLWLMSEYPSAEYVYFGDITSIDQLDPYRVLFWIRDIDEGDEAQVWAMPQVVEDATETIKEWYKGGGNLLLWSHAVTFITNLGRIDGDLLRSNDHTIGTGVGGWNGDTWSMAVELYPGSNFKIDFSSHQIYRGLDVTTTDQTKLIAVKGPGWTEDHNCVFFNIPTYFTGIGNQDEACYTQLTEQFGIYPLAVWDSQIDWISQFNIWEARQGDTEFEGTILCMGNGGCEISMKNADGTPDISANPQNNIYEANVLLLAKNCLEYLKTR